MMKHMKKEKAFKITKILHQFFYQPSDSNSQCEDWHPELLIVPNGPLFTRELALAKR